MGIDKYYRKAVFPAALLGVAECNGILKSGGVFQGTYAQSAIQNYILGTRRIIWDGRVFKYAKATNTITDCKQGLKFWAQIADGIAYTAPLQTQLVGDTTIKVDSGKGAAGVAKDELIGGYVMIHTHGDNYQHFRGIIGNTLADINGYITITLDAPLNVAITLDHGVEVYPNPYVSVRLANSTAGHPGNKYSSVAGMPNVVTTVANQYIWIQTWGPIWINPHGSSLQDAGIAVNERRVVFDWEGSISIQEDCVNATDDHQSAGFIIDRNAAGASGPPLVMLQISI